MKKQTIILWFFILCLPAALHYGLKYKDSTPIHSMTFANDTTPAKTSIDAPTASMATEAQTKTQAQAVEHPSTQPQPTQTQAIQNWTTAKGAKVYFVQNNTLPMLDVRLSMDAGSSRDADHEGLAALWLSLLDQGTAQLSADQIAEQFENTGALFSSTLSKDEAALKLRTLSDPKTVATLIDLLAELIANPAFADQSIASIKAQQLVGIQQKQQQPNLIAQDAFYKAIYGDHPYAHPSSGTAKSLEAISRQDLQAFHARYAVAKNITISLVGNLSLEDARTLAERLMQKLPEGTAAPALPAVHALQASTTQDIDYAAEQTQIIMGAPCMAANDPDYFALSLGNYILGENAFISRLFEEVREKRGLAYGIGSRLNPFKRLGPFTIKLQTKNSQTQEAIDVVKATLALFLKEGPSEEEIEEAKTGLIRAFPMEMNNNAKLSDALARLAFYDLPLDFFETYQQRIQALTRTEVRDALQKHLNPEKMALIIVGPQKAAAVSAP